MCETALQNRHTSSEYIKELEMVKENAFGFVSLWIFLLILRHFFDPMHYILSADENVIPHTQSTEAQIIILHALHSVG